ncbi:Sodium-coupled neutral amino acid transporter 9 [Fasciola gigantica]|uniref:Sodium-coupled neutral amino acid transporter 9 n=1 Tax=Fasciola gigantica TaxID=46835 RepID=A0A504YQR0_FASGI|nr:Sodium-coupled neutral amino acid transporter 9 [Fasciola gigantica]
MTKSQGEDNGDSEKNSERRNSVGGAVDKKTADSYLDSGEKPDKVRVAQTGPTGDAQGLSLSMEHNEESSGSGTPRPRASVDLPNNDGAAVFMRVSDPDCEAGMRRFGNFPIMREDELPGADMDKKTLEQNNVVYLITDSLDGTNDSGVDSPGDSKSDQRTQGSLVAIFSVWNTMMGTSILAMPWALKEAGFGFGIFLIALVGTIACYTAYLTIKSTEDLKLIKNIGESAFLDLSDACEYHLGKAGRIIAVVFSQLALLGGMIVYYVVLSNFLYNTGNFIYERVNGIDTSINPNATDGFNDIFCDSGLPKPNTTQSGGSGRELYDRLWSQTGTVPAWLLLLLFPLLSIRSPTFLSKFTSLATVSVAYLFILICIKAARWGVHMGPNTEGLRYINVRFPSLTGTCSLAYFIHNSLHTLLRSQKNPEKNGRNIVLAFLFTTLTYMIIGILFYIIFPITKNCIADNFLNNLTADIPVFIGRLALLFQMSTVFPMLVYVLRAQIMYVIFKSVYPGVLHVMGLHAILLLIGLLFAMFFPSIGTIIRYIGALCGFVYIFTLPPLITLLNKRCLGRIPDPTSTEVSVESGSAETPGSRPLLTISPETKQKTVWRDQKTKRLWYLRAAGYSIIMLLGLGNFVGQFIVQFLA